MKKDERSAVVDDFTTRFTVSPPNNHRDRDEIRRRQPTGDSWTGIGCPGGGVSPGRRWESGRRSIGFIRADWRWGNCDSRPCDNRFSRKSAVPGLSRNRRDPDIYRVYRFGNRHFHGDRSCLQDWLPARRNKSRESHVCPSSAGEVTFTALQPSPRLAISYPPS